MERIVMLAQDKNIGTRVQNNVRIALKVLDTYNLFLNVHANQPLPIKFLKAYVLPVILLSISINQLNNVFHVNLQKNSIQWLKNVNARKLYPMTQLQDVSAATSLNIMTLLTKLAKIANKISYLIFLNKNALDVLKRNLFSERTLANLAHKTNI